MVLVAVSGVSVGGDEDRGRFGGGGDDSPDGDAGRRVAIFDDVLVVLDLLVLVYFLFFVCLFLAWAVS